MKYLTNIFCVSQIKCIAAGRGGGHQPAGRGRRHAAPLRRQPRPLRHREYRHRQSSLHSFFVFVFHPSLHGQCQRNVIRWNWTNISRAECCSEKWEEWTNCDQWPALQPAAVLMTRCKYTSCWPPLHLAPSRGGNFTNCYDVALKHCTMRLAAPLLIAALALHPGNVWGGSDIWMFG